MISSICGNPMGATQRLSKPPTNTSASNLLKLARQQSEPPSPLIPSDGDSMDGYFTTVKSANGECRSRRNTRSKIRAYLHGPDSRRSNSSDDDESSPTKLANVARDVRRRLSRTDSSVTQKSGGESPAFSRSRLLLADLSSLTLDENDMVKEQIKEKVWTDQIAAQNHVAPPVDEDKHPDSVLSPIRRRSLYTPGIATRSPDDILRKPPPPGKLQSQADREYYYNPRLPQSSPLSSLATLGLPQNGRSTPSDLDYSHLGGLKVGTLRITNGAASPAPREQIAASRTTLDPDFNHQRESYMVSEVGRSGEEDKVITDSSREIEIHSRRENHRLSLDQSYRDIRDMTPPGRSGLAGTISRSISPVKNHPYEPQSEICDADRSSSTCVTSIKRKPLPSMALAKKRDRTRSIANDYISEIPAGPFSSGEGVYFEQGRSTAIDKSWTFGVTDREEVESSSEQHSREQTACGYSFDNSLSLHTEEGSREDALRALVGELDSRPKPKATTASPSSASAQSDFDMSPSKNRSPHLDSGYNSFESLQSTDRSSTDLSKMLKSRTMTVLPKTSHPTLDKQAWETQSGHSAGNSIPEMKAVENRHSSSMLSQISTDIAPLSISPENHTQALDKIKKLRKTRPKSQPPLSRCVVQRDHDLSLSDIPPIPSAIALQHSERLSTFPVLEHTFPSRQHIHIDDVLPSPAFTAAPTRFPSPAQDSESKPTFMQNLATRARSRSRSKTKEVTSPVQSSTDEFLESDICRSPSWSAFGKKKKTQEKLEKVEHTDQVSTNKLKNRKRRLSRPRSRSSSKAQSGQREPLKTLTHLGDVTSSLGSSPYDVARHDHRAVTQTTFSASPVQSHQMSIIPKAKSINARDGEDFNQVHDQERSQTFVRSGSQGKAPIDDHVSISGKAIRPQSMFARMLPVHTSAQVEAPDQVLPCKTEHEGNEFKIVRTPTEMPPSAASLERKSIVGRKGEASPSSRNCRIHVETESFPDMTISKPATVEELIDGLLDAPNNQARDHILEQLRQRRSGQARSSKDVKRETIAHEVLSSAIDRDEPHCISGQRGWLSDRHGSAISPQNKNLETSNDNHSTGGRKSVENVLPENLRAEKPDVLSFTVEKEVERDETKISSARPTEQIISRQIQKTEASEAPKKDLWKGCAEEMEQKKAIESRQGWEPHRMAWSRRRKSAGEALLLTNRLDGLEKVHSPLHHQKKPEEERPKMAIRAMTAEPEQLSMPRNNGSKAFHKPWTFRQDADDSQARPFWAEVTKEASKVTKATQAFERLAGRYEGGLSYGYEPGFGLGGSAGTRSVKTGATRKSIQMSRGFGVDLSDVPVFVAPS